MGMTFWLKTDPEAAHADGRDLSFLCQASSPLDEICAALGVAPVSSFGDEGAAAGELADLFPELDLEAPAGQEWAGIPDGIRTFHALLETLLGNGELVADALREIGRGVTLDRLIDEVEYVLAVLDEVGEGRFCLTLVS